MSIGEEIQFEWHGKVVTGTVRSLKDGIISVV